MGGGWNLIHIHSGERIKPWAMQANWCRLVRRCRRQGRHLEDRPARNDRQVMQGRGFPMTIPLLVASLVGLAFHPYEADDPFCAQRKMQRIIWTVVNTGASLNSFSDYWFSEIRAQSDWTVQFDDDSKKMGFSRLQNNCCRIFFNFTSHQFFCISRIFGAKKCINTISFRCIKLSASSLLIANYKIGSLSR